MKVTLKFTHRGWFGICPVYVSDPEGWAPVIEPRHLLLTLLFWVSEAAIETIHLVRRAMDPQYEGMYFLLITGELEKPYVVEAEDADA